MKLCGFDVGLDQPLFLIAGPCVIESMQLQIDVAGRLKEITGRLGMNSRATCGDRRISVCAVPRCWATCLA